jgi:hypothetical protein
MERLLLNFEDDRKHNAGRFLVINDPIKTELNHVNMTLKQSIIQIMDELEQMQTNDKKWRTETENDVKRIDGRQVKQEKLFEQL